MKISLYKSIIDPEECDCTLDDEYETDSINDAIRQLERWIPPLTQDYHAYADDWLSITYMDGHTGEYLELSAHVKHPSKYSVSRALRAMRERLS